MLGRTNFMQGLRGRCESRALACLVVEARVPAYILHLSAPSSCLQILFERFLVAPECVIYLHLSERRPDIVRESRLGLSSNP